MYIVPIAWLYVTVLMSIAEANSSAGSLLGAVITFLLYGLLPIGILSYIMATPARKRARKARAARNGTPQKELDSVAPDTGSHASADVIATEREKM